MPEKQTLRLTAAMFRLKQNYINVENEKYTENLKSYLDSARSSTNLTIYYLKTWQTLTLKMLKPSQQIMKQKNHWNWGSFCSFLGQWFWITFMASGNCGKNCEFRNSSVVLPEKNGQC